jgi:hypothetical protein
MTFDLQKSLDVVGKNVCSAEQLLPQLGIKMGRDALFTLLRN